MELLRNVMFLRGVQLILIILAGITFVIVGYKLFLYGIDTGRSKLRRKSEGFKLLFSGSGPGLLFMVIGGLIVLYSILSIGVPSDIAFLKNKLTAGSEQSANPLSADAGLSDTTITTHFLAEASISGISSRPSPAERTDPVKPTSKRQIKRSINPAGLYKTPGKKSIYRSQDELSKVINKHNSAIEYCYKKELRSNPTLKGDLDVEFTIDYSGKVKAVRIVRSSIYSRNIEKCISNRILAWRFKAISEADGDVKVRQKYIFG